MSFMQGSQDAGALRHVLMLIEEACQHFVASLVMNPFLLRMRHMYSQALLQIGGNILLRSLVDSWLYVVKK